MTSEYLGGKIEISPPSEFVGGGANVKSLKALS